MILYSDHDLIKGTMYRVNDKPLKFLGMTHAHCGTGVFAQYRFKGEGVNSYATKTAQELNKATVVIL